MLRNILILFSVIVSVSFAEDALVVLPEAAITGLISSNTSSSNSSTTNTQPQPTTTTISPTTRTTSQPTTTSATNTTIKPTISTTKPSSTTPVPEPTPTIPPPQKGHYIVPNETCLIADFAIQITVNMASNLSSLTFDVPTNVTVNGSCSNTTDELHLSWGDEGYLFFVFMKNESASKYMVSQISLVMNGTTFKITEEKFVTSVSKSYKCDKEQEIKLMEETQTNNNSFAILKISQVHFQAFHSSNDEKFGAAEDCAESSSTDVVPIVVGCALVVLIIIVLVAYLLGRRRSQNRGYLSM